MSINLESSKHETQKTHIITCFFYIAKAISTEDTSRFSSAGTWQLIYCWCKCRLTVILERPNSQGTRSCHYIDISLWVMCFRYYELGPDDPPYAAKFWDCCGSEDPQAEGCKTSVHVSYDDDWMWKLQSGESMCRIVCVGNLKCTGQSLFFIDGFKDPYHL